jgi:phenylacetate-CoA ligase
MPYPFKVVAASARGWSLRRWRYGERSQQLMAEALERDLWSAGQWQAWQQEQLTRLLDHAARNVPYYRDQWDSRRRAGDRAGWEYLENWPILSKDALRQHSRALLADGCDPDNLFADHTSGTSGKPLTIWWRREQLQRWYAIFDGRARAWNGIRPGQRWAIIGGQLVAPYNRARPPFWVWNATQNQLYLSSYHLKPENAAAYLDALRRYQVTYLLGYPSSIHSLATFAREQGLEAPSLQVVISNAEPLFDHQRESIAGAFHCRVVNTYGMSEVVTAASECAAGQLHLWPDTGVTEVLRDDSDQPAAPGETGRLVCTGLINTAMPLIRYQVGDRGSLLANSTPCACGRTMPALASVEGRIDGVIITPDGRRIGRLDPVFKADLPLREAQIIQHSLNEIELVVVPAEGFSNHSRETLRHRLQERVGDMTIRVSEVDSIPRSANGKFRAVVSHLDQS